VRCGGYAVYRTKGLIMTEDRPDHMKAVNTSLTPPEVDVSRPDYDPPPAQPTPFAVPIEGDEEVRRTSPGDRGNRDTPGAASTRPGTDPGRPDA
jgi:hypothetical protein